MSGPINGSKRSRMVLERFRVQNYRCIVDAELTLERDVTVLVGRNDVGKTALLDALHEYGQVGQQGLRYASARDELADETPTRLHATWLDETTGVRYEHALSCDERQPEEQLCWGATTCLWNPRTRRLRVDGEDWDARGIRRALYLPAISLSDWRTGTDVPDDITEHLCRAKGFVTPTPFLLQPHALGSDTPPDLSTVEGSGFGWAWMLQQLVSERDDRIERLEAGMTRLFPHFRRARAIEERWELRRLVSGSDAEPTARRPQARPPRYLQAAAEGSSGRRVEVQIVGPTPSQPSLLDECRWVPAYAVSSGILLTLAYLTVAMASPEGSLLALEEPENGLNRVVTERMMELFLETVRERGHQLLMTTHNEFWLDLVGPASVRVLTRDEHGTRINADPANLQRIIDEDLYLSEVMALGGPEGLLDPRRGDAT